MVVHVVMVDGKEIMRDDDKGLAQAAFDGAAKESEFTQRVELLRVVATATRGVNITKSYRERTKPTVKRGPRKVKQAGEAS